MNGFAKQSPMENRLLPSRISDISTISRNEMPRRTQQQQSNDDEGESVVATEHLQYESPLITFGDITPREIEVLTHGKSGRGTALGNSVIKSKHNADSSKYVKKKMSVSSLDHRIDDTGVVGTPRPSGDDADLTNDIHSKLLKQETRKYSQPTYTVSFTAGSHAPPQQQTSTLSNQWKNYSQQKPPERRNNEKKQPADKSMSKVNTDKV